MSRRRLLSAALAVALAVAGLLLLAERERRGEERRARTRASLDAAVDEMDGLLKQVVGRWEAFETGQRPARAAYRRLRRARDQLEELAERIDGLADPAPGDSDAALARRQRQARDLARAARGATAALETTAHFHAALGPLSRSAEARGSRAVAAGLFRDFDELRGRYGAGETAPGLEEPPRPIERLVFVIVLDATRADHLSAYGYPRDTSPRIAELAREGVLFERATAQASVTNTSVASLLTGLYPRAHGMLGGHDWLWDRSLVESLRRAGFATAAFSANPLIAREERFDHGFDHFEELFWGRAAVVVGQALRWIERARSRHDKLFVYLHLMDPHDRYFPPAEFVGRLGGRPARRGTLSAFALDQLIEFRYPELAAQAAECDYDPAREHWGDPDRLLACVSRASPQRPFTRADLAALTGRYDEEILYADHQIGYLLRSLEASGSLARSTVVITSDHGESFLEHNRMKHGRTLYENLIHVPLVVWQREPRLGPERVSRPVEVVDVLPTLLRLLGIEPPAGVHGRDLFAADADRPVFSFTWNGRDLRSGDRLELSALRDRRFKYIATSPPGAPDPIREELYDLDADPGEQRDLAASHPEELRRLRARLRAWTQTTAAAAAADRPLDAEASKSQRERLRALGYVE